MSTLSIAPKSAADAQMKSHLTTFARRIETTPPGMCPVALHLSLLEASEVQSCGKCVPCRDGIPQLAALLRRVVDCKAEPSDLDAIASLAQVVRDMSDCAIGYHAADVLLQGMEAFAEEFRSHVEDRSCTPGIEQLVPCEAFCPAHVNVPAYIALAAQGDCAGAVNMVRKDNPFPTACALVCEHPCEERCRRRLIDAPINIRVIKKYACDNAPADTVPVPKRSVDTGRSVAVIGAGPSGMTCAYFLALMGHRVVVLEARKKLGGMMR